MKQVQRFDIREILRASKTPNGFLKSPVRATRVGIFVYRDEQGKESRELRLPEEVFKKASMDTLAMIPITIEHPFQLLDPSNAKTHMVGYTGETVYKDDDTYLSTTALITDQRAIERIESGKDQVSLGYKATLDMTPGYWNGSAIVNTGSEGEKFNAIQRDIVYNHLAVVDKGRAGAEVKLRLDSEMNLIELQDKKEEKSMKVKIGDKEFEVEQDVAGAINGLIKQRDAFEKKTKDRKDSDEKELAEKMDTLEKENEELKGRNDSFESELEKANDPQVFNTRLKDRVALLDSAKKVLDQKEHEKLDAMSDLEIKKAVIVADDAEVKFDGKSEDYIAGRFEHVTKVKADKEDDDKGNKGFGDELHKDRTDSANPGTDFDKKQAARKDEISKAWQKPLN
jgi:hypothetical protein